MMSTHSRVYTRGHLGVVRSVGVDRRINLDSCPPLLSLEKSFSVLKSSSLPWSSLSSRYILATLDPSAVSMVWLFPERHRVGVIQFGAFSHLASFT